MSDGLHRLFLHFRKAARNWRWATSFHNALFAGSVFLLLLLLILGLDYVVYFTHILRYAFFLALVFSLLFLLYFTLNPWMRRLSREWIARRLEIHNSGLENLLINCTQLSRNSGGSPSYLTPLLQKALERLDNAVFSLGIHWRRIQWLSFTCIICIFALSTPFILHYERSMNTLKRVAFPWAQISPYYATQIRVEPGDAAIPHGDSLPIRIKFSGQSPNQAQIVTYREEEDWVKSHLNLIKGTMSTRYRFDNISQSFSYHVEAGDGRSPIYHIAVLPRPVIVAISIELKYPTYTGKAQEKLHDVSGGLAALKGTRAIVCATADIPITKGHINLRQGKFFEELEGQIHNRRCLKANFNITENGFFSLEMFTKDDIGNANPVKYDITAIPDAPPTVELPLPGRDRKDIPLPSKFPCLARAQDDWGIHNIELLCCNLAKKVTTVIGTKTNARGKALLALDTILDVTSSRFEPGQTLELFARARDTLGQTGESPRYKIQLATIKNTTAAEGIETKELAEVMDELRDSLEKQKAEKEKEDEKETVLGMLDELWKKQEELIPPTKDLLEIPKEQRVNEQEDELERLAMAEKRLLEDIRDFNEYLKELAPAAFDDPSLLDEFKEVVDNVERAEESLIGNAVEIALGSEEAALNCIEKLEERIESELESWLPEKPDRTKWNLEDAPMEQIDEISMVDLPEELEDLVGELIEDEEDINEQTEDLSSNWASADLEEGWEVMDGQISNFSAKGKTGNTLPDSTEATGRSGEGRTGKSNGEFVEKFAQHKDDRQTGPRMRDEPFEDAVVQELDNKPPSQSTGGGKKSGMGPEGFTGRPPATLQNKLNRLAEQQEAIRQKAETLDKQLNNLYLSPKQLKASIENMKSIEEDLKAFRLKELMEKQRDVIKDLSQIQKAITDPMASFIEKKEQVEETAAPAQSLKTERFPRYYEKALKLYFRSLEDRGQ